MSERRKELQIVAEILELCRVPSGKTAIVYKCNMNFYTATQYLDKLIGANMIHIINTGQHPKYETTLEGTQYIYEALKAVDIMRLIDVKP